MGLYKGMKNLVKYGSMTVVALYAFSSCVHDSADVRESKLEHMIDTGLEAVEHTFHQAWESAFWLELKVKEMRGFDKEEEKERRY